MSLDSIPTLPRALNVSGDDLIGIIDMADRRSPKSAPLSDVVSATLINEALDGETLEVAGVTLTDATGTALPAGTLSLNANGDVVLHDGNNNAEDLPNLLNSNNRVATNLKVLAAAVNDEAQYESVLGSFLLPASEIVSGKVLCFRGYLHFANAFTSQPDGGTFLCLRKKGVTDASYYMTATLPTSAGEHHINFSIFMEVDGSSSLLNGERCAASAKAMPTTTGAFVSNAAIWDPGDDLTIPVGAGDLVTIGQEAALEIVFLSSDASGTVAGSSLVLIEASLT